MGEFTDLQGHTVQLGAQLRLVLSKYFLQILLRTQQTIHFFYIFSNLEKNVYKNQLCNS